MGANAHPFFLEEEMDVATKPFDVNEIETGIEDIVRNAKESKNLYDQFRPRARGPEGDSINHPSHYNAHPSGVECIAITEHMNFCRGNAVKYIWRADEKGDPIENLKKARWYLDREIERLSK